MRHMRPACEDTNRTFSPKAAPQVRRGMGDCPHKNIYALGLAKGKCAAFHLSVGWDRKGESGCTLAGGPHPGSGLFVGLCHDILVWSAVLLAELAGLRPAAVLCELMNRDGTMMRREQVRDYVAREGLTMISIERLAQQRNHDARLGILS